uniref:Uncharacterized protein n=1 Tax=Daphnia magna TaxID=35525 RepID=A0A0P5ZU53_9CRUS
MCPYLSFFLAYYSVKKREREKEREREKNFNNLIGTTCQRRFNSPVTKLSATGRYSFSICIRRPPSYQLHLDEVDGVCVCVSQASQL